ncbi:Putative TIM-barrel fold metal-dependent hydrolase [Idiomarina sp. A28L]|uniref:amidohydrolase n=1 Tax=Idiomarina sp. A28L TaxID=1036674 RepID=UPI00021388A2|nr:Putative TIM-barrel fold metal-dependent hydrolase [Idiomarina sp. A28L]
MKAIKLLSSVLSLALCSTNDGCKKLYNLPSLKSRFAVIASAFLFTGALSVSSAQAVSSAQESGFENHTVFHNFNGYTFTGSPGKTARLLSFTVMVIADGKIVDTGNQQLIEQYEGARKINLLGRTVLPGLIDSHGHISSLGENLSLVDVRGTTSRTQAVAAVANYAHKNQHHEWIVGRGWNQELWPDRRFPTRQDLDEVINDRPVWLVRVDAHAGWANSKALEMAGINDDTVDPPGGQIIRDSSGKATGVLIDTAMAMVQQALPIATDEQLTDINNKAFEHLLSLGITQVHDAGVDARRLGIFRDLAAEGELPLRVNAMIASSEPTLAELLAAGTFRSADDMLQINSVKVYGDGALGSRGARLIEPYSDDEGNTGLLINPEERVRELFTVTHNSGFQINYHAIGDYTNRLALNEFERLPASEHEYRHRVEHAQIVSMDDIPRFLALNIIPSMQPTHATSDMNMAEDRVGSERIAGAYAWREFLDQGSLIAAGSDFPVELANPFYGIHAAVTRQDRDNQPVEGWYPEQRMSLQEALRSFTLDAAYAGHLDNVTGTLEPGKWADFIVLDQNPMRIKPEDLWRIRIEYTFVAGKKVYKRPI